MEAETSIMAPQWLESRGLSDMIALDLDDTSNSTKSGLRAIIQTMESEKVLMGRYLRITLGSLSSALAAFVIYRIWHDSWRASKLMPRPNAKRCSFLWSLHCAEVFPIILSFTIFISTMSIVGVQANALESIITEDCKDSGAIVLPAMLALGFLHFVFGLATTARALKLVPFNAKCKIAFVLDTVVFAILIIATIVVANVQGFEQDKCIGSTAFRISSLQLSRGLITIMGILIVSLLAMATTIAIQLLRTIHLDPNERIAASRMVYYLITTSLLQVFVLPFFVVDYFGSKGSDLASAAVAEFMLFAAGAILALLHLFLRANASRTAIKPRETPWQKTRRFRFFGPNDLEIMNISPPLNLINPNFRPDEKVAEIYAKQQSVYRNPSIRTPLPQFSFPTKPLKVDTRRTPTPTKSWPLPDVEDGLPPLPATPSEPSPRSKSPQRQQSYALFPVDEEIKLPSAVYSPPSTKPLTKYNLPPRSTSLVKPSTGPFGASVTDISSASLELAENLKAPDAPWLPRRGSSAESSRTVQIGIRLSSTPSQGVQSTRQSHAQVPRMGSIAEGSASTTSSAYYSDVFTAAFQQAAPETSGRDLNSFRWIDTPSDDGPSTSTVRDSSTLAGSPTLRASDTLLSSAVYVPPARSNSNKSKQTLSPSTADADSPTFPTATKPHAWI